MTKTEIISKDLYRKAYRLKRLGIFLEVGRVSEFNPVYDMYMNIEVLISDDTSVRLNMGRLAFELNHYSTRDEIQRRKNLSEFKRIGS